VREALQSVIKDVINSDDLDLEVDPSVVGTVHAATRLGVGADGCRSCTARAWSSRKCARGWRTCSRSICRSARRSTIRLPGQSTFGVSGELEAGRAHAHDHNRSPAAADMDGGVRGGDRRLGEEDAVLDALPRSGDAPGCTSAFD
jgi:hypothetical protein